MLYMDNIASSCLVSRLHLILCPHLLPQVAVSKCIRLWEQTSSAHKPLTNSIQIPLVFLRVFIFPSIAQLTDFVKLN